MGCLMPETDRDLKGYGRKRPFADWPGGARVAVSFVLNYEEGGERSVADGDAQAENYLVPEVVGLDVIPVQEIPPFPSELLGQGRLDELLAWARDPIDP